MSTAQPGSSSETTSAPLRPQYGSPAPQTASLIEVAGWALADMGVREPGAALLEPVALALSSLDARASRKKQSEV